jgi:uncharacterized Fe-S center protein
MLKKAGLPEQVKGKRVAIKMHLGGDIGYTTIHPIFVRTLVDTVKNGGAESVKVIDGKDPKEGAARGYTPEILGCPVKSCFGENGNSFMKESIGYKTLDEALIGKEALDCDFFIDLSHVKGHGACGFGGALKNIAMGVVPPQTRSKLHKLEGGLSIDKSRCKYCLKCFQNCPNDAIRRADEDRSVKFFFHNCTYCQHCVMICPENAITMGERKFADFARGMAKVTAAFLKKFSQENTMFINFLTNITVYCDCWGFSTPSLVPDIGILLGKDITAIDTASLDMIKAEDLIPNGLPKGRVLVEGNHLFEKIHGKDPYLMVRYLTEEYGGRTDYQIFEVK